LREKCHSPSIQRQARGADWFLKINLGANIYLGILAARATPFQVSLKANVCEYTVVME